MSDFWDDESARLRKTVENELMKAVGLPIPHPEHEAELQNFHERKAEARRRWES